MANQALIFGSVGTLVETSDMQRRAFNAAFAAEGLDWYWDKRTYADLLQSSGGAARIAHFAESLNETVDADQVHATKVALFGQMMARDGLTLRPGVGALIKAAHASDIPVAFATTTGATQLDAMFDALAVMDEDALSRDDFAFVGDADTVVHAKPAPDIFEAALRALGVAAADAVAIEDSAVNAAAPLVAGITTFVTPGEMHLGRDMPQGAIVLRELSPDVLVNHQMAAQ